MGLRVLGSGDYFEVQDTLVSQRWWTVVMRDDGNHFITSAAGRQLKPTSATGRKVVRAVEKTLGDGK